MSKTYKISVTREGKWWMIAIPELDALTQARRLDDITTMARELIALETGVALADVAVEQRIELVAGGEDVAARARSVRDHRERVSAEEERVQAEMGQFAKELAAADVPVRDIGSLLGVAHQRVSQLVNH